MAKQYINRMTDKDNLKLDQWDHYSTMDISNLYVVTEALGPIELQTDNC